MIEIERLSKCYGSFRAVDDLTLSIPDGEVLGLLGPNGAGKTTTIRIITGYLPPSAGRASVDGFDSVTDSHDVRRRIGYLPESNPLYGEMRVTEYLDYRGRLFGLSRTDRKTAAARVIERCWLTEMQRRLISRLSKGYRQRVGLAAAMLHSPAVLILDEPTSGLDPKQIQETRHLIRELAGDHTMILSSHILHEVELTCDRVAIISAGQLKAQGTVSELRMRAGERAHYCVEMQGENGTDISKAIQSVKGVDGVEAIPARGWTRLNITTSPGVGDIREDLGRVVNQSGQVCRELSREAESLEQLFVRITANTDPLTNSAKGGDA